MSALGVFIALGVFLGMPHMQPLRADFVTNRDIDAQSVVVQERIVTVLEEYVKYLQLVLIDRLEMRVSILKAQVGALR